MKKNSPLPQKTQADKANQRPSKQPSPVTAQNQMVNGALNSFETMPEGLQAASVLQMQRQQGNGYVQRVLAQQNPKAPVQTAVTNTAFIQRHSSYEHRLFGDTPTEQLVGMAGNLDPKNRQHVLSDERERFRMWMTNPEAVTDAQIKAQWPDIRTLKLKKSGLLITYGELNSMPDYMASPQAIDNAEKSVVLPLIQTVRQQSFNRLTDMIGAKRTVQTGRGGAVQVPDHQHFEGAVGPNGEKGTMAAINEVSALDKVTKNEGGGVNQYSALLARNACHFAPFSWSRWEEFHTQARALAQQGHDKSDKDQIRQAWLNNGYADHFLQDSFAAGHLINKTKVMQWFVEWAEANNVQLKNWWRIRNMTTDKQPGISAPQLYNAPHKQGAATDPQTAQEGSSKQARTNASGVQAQGGYSQGESYENYLAFLNSSAVQAASGAVHDYFNERSLWVSSPAVPKAYQIWGDETMLNGGDGVRYASETAMLSQQAIEELSTTGKTAITPQQIRNRFPNQVWVNNKPLSLEDWHTQLRALCFKEIFPDVHYKVIDTLSSTLGKVSNDMPAEKDLSDTDIRSEVGLKSEAELAKKPVTERIQMVIRLTQGATMDADELTILSILKASLSKGDLVTVVDAAGAWKLASTTDGDEYKTLRAFLKENYYANTSQQMALNLIRECMDGETAEWEEEMIADIIVKRGDRRAIVTQIGKIYDNGGFAEGLNKLQWQLDGAEQDQVEAALK